MGLKHLRKQPQHSWAEKYDADTKADPSRNLSKVSIKLMTSGIEQTIEIWTLTSPTQTVL